MYFITKCWDTKCHGTPVGKFHTKYHVEPNRVRHWAQQILQVTRSTKAYSSVQAVSLLLIHITSRTGETKSGTCR